MFVELHELNAEMLSFEMNIIVLKRRKQVKNNFFYCCTIH